MHHTRSWVPLLRRTAIVVLAFIALWIGIRFFTEYQQRVAYERAVRKPLNELVVTITEVLAKPKQGVSGNTVPLFPMFDEANRSHTAPIDLPSDNIPALLTEMRRASPSHNVTLMYTKTVRFDPAGNAILHVGKVPKHPRSRLEQKYTLSVARNNPVTVLLKHRMLRKYGPLYPSPVTHQPLPQAPPLEGLYKVGLTYPLTYDHADRSPVVAGPGARTGTPVRGETLLVELITIREGKGQDKTVAQIP